MHLQIYSFSGRKILHWFWPLDSLARTISGFIGFKIDKAGLPVQMWNNYLHSLATSGCDELSVHIPFLSQLVLDAAICSFIFPHFPMQHAMPMSKVLAFWHSLPLHIQQGFSTNEDLSQFQTFQGAWWKEKAFSNLNPFWNSTWRQLDWPSSVVWYFAHAHALIKKGMSMYVAHLDPLWPSKTWGLLLTDMFFVRKWIDFVYVGKQLAAGI